MGWAWGSRQRERERDRGKSSWKDGGRRVDRSGLMVEERTEVWTE